MPGRRPMRHRIRRRLRAPRGDGRPGAGPRSRRRARRGRGGAARCRSPRTGSPRAVWCTRVGQHLVGGLGTDVVERLERLVGEVEGVAAVEEHVVGDRREHGPLDLVERRARRQRGGEHALGGVAGAGVDEAPVPVGQAGRRRHRRRRRRRAAAGSGADGPGCHGPRSGARGRARRAWSSASSDGEEVGHRDQDGEPGAPPAVVVAGAEVDTAPHDLRVRHPEVAQAEHRLGDHQRDPRLEAVVEATPQVRDGIADRAGRHEDVVTVADDVEAASVVGEGVEGAAGGEIEPGVVPVARHQPLLDRPLVEREAHVGTAVLDGPGPALVPEHHHRQACRPCPSDDLRSAARRPIRPVPRWCRSPPRRWAAGAERSRPTRTVTGGSYGCSHGDRRRHHPSEGHPVHCRRADPAPRHPPVRRPVGRRPLGRGGRDDDAPVVAATADLVDPAAPWSRREDRGPPLRLPRLAVG